MEAKTATRTPKLPGYEARIVARRPKNRKASDYQLKEGRDIARLCADIVDLSQECMQVLTLNQKHFVIDRHMISLGTLSGAPVHPREVFRVAIFDNAAAIALVHNHPSGEPAPSRDDREITARLVEAGRLLGIRVLDHVIVADKGHFSFVEEGLL